MRKFLVTKYVDEENKSFQCLITVVIANSEHARSGIRPYFFDNSASRMELKIDDLTEAFIRIKFPYFRGKPKVFIIYVS